jgi:hypothetical protein
MFLECGCHFAERSAARMRGDIPSELASIRVSQLDVQTDVELKMRIGSGVTIIAKMTLLSYGNSLSIEKYRITRMLPGIFAVWEVSQ